MLNNARAELIRQYMHLMSKWDPSPGNWGFCEPGDQQRKLAESPTNGKVNRLTTQTKPKKASSDRIRLIFKKKKVESKHIKHKTKQPSRKNWSQPQVETAIFALSLV